MEPSVLDPKQPKFGALMDKNENGAYRGSIYVSIEGFPQGHLEIHAHSLEVLTALYHGLGGYLQSQSRIVTPTGVKIG